VRYYRLLAVALLLGGGLSWRAAAPGAAQTAPLMATRAVDGVGITLSVPAGPLFLGELISATVTLTNTTSGPLRYMGGPGPSLCSPNWMVLSGGSAPRYPIPAPWLALCPAPFPHLLAPGHSSAATGLIPLTASGRVLLVARPWLLGPRNEWVALGGPALALSVTPSAPPTRTLLLTYRFSKVRVSLAQGILPPLVSQSMENYTNGWGETGAWFPLHGHILPELYSPSMGHPTTWIVLVGAPGYRVAVGVYKHAP